MKRRHLSIAALLHMAHLAITNGRANEEIRAVISRHGYDEEGLRGGEQLYQAALQAIETRKNHASAQCEATAKLKAARKEAEHAYQGLAQVARAVLDNAGLTTLGLNGIVSRSIAAFLGRAGALFHNAGEPEILAKLAVYGYDQTALDDEDAKIDALRMADLAQEVSKGIAQNATHEQDAALRALDDWLRQYVRIARALLRHKKYLLDALGMSVRKRKRQKAQPVLIERAEPDDAPVDRPLEVAGSQSSEL